MHKPLSVLFALKPGVGYALLRFQCGVSSRYSVLLVPGDRSRSRPATYVQAPIAAKIAFVSASARCGVTAPTTSIRRLP